MKYGDLPVLLALSAPHSLGIASEDKQVIGLIRSVYDAAGASDKLTAIQSSSASALVDWLLGQ